MHTPHRAVRRTVTAAAALGLTAAGVLTATTAVAAPATDTTAESAAGALATASRTTGLAASGDEVTVTARGFAPSARVSVGLYGDRTLDKDGARTLVADGNGFVATPLVVGTAFAADAKTYEIRVSAQGGPSARVAITFAAGASDTTAVTASADAGAPQARALAGALPMAAPMAAGSGVGLTVSPSTGVDPAGASLTVKGTGYVAGSGNGVYVVFGPKSADWTTNAGNYGASEWLRAVPAAGSKSIDADGTFSVTLSGVKAKYKDGNGKDVDCLTTQCYVLTMAAHGSPDRSQDAFTEISFKGGGSTTTGGSTTGGSTTGDSTTGGTTTGGSTTEGSTTGGTTSGGSGDSTTGGTTTGGGDSGKSDGGSLPITGAAGIATAATVGAALVAAGATAVVTTRRRRGDSSSTPA